jgi:hypothetical protein
MAGVKVALLVILASVIIAALWGGGFESFSYKDF